MPSTLLIDQARSLPFSTRSPVSFPPPSPTISHLKKEEEKAVSNGFENEPSASPSPPPPRAVIGQPTELGHAPSRRDEDQESIFSYAASTHSILDDVPRTPKRPLSVFDPRNPSVFTEALYVSIGLGVIALGAVLTYRFVRGRK